MGEGTTIEAKGEQVPNVRSVSDKQGVGERFREFSHLNLT